MKKLVLFLTVVLNLGIANADIQILDPVFSQAPEVSAEVLSPNKIRVTASGYSSCEKEKNILVSHSKPHKKLNVVNFYLQKSGGLQLSKACVIGFSYDLFVSRPTAIDSKNGEVVVFLNFEGDSIPEEMVRVTISVSIVAVDEGDGTIGYDINKINKVEISGLK